MKPLSKEEIIHFIKKTTFEFKATQEKLCVPLINRLAHKMSVGLAFPDIKVCDGMLIDGHHRYIASRLTDYGIGIAPHAKNSETTEKGWEQMELLDHDYDSPEKINEFLEIDAFYNKKSKDEIVELLNKQ